MTDNAANYLLSGSANAPEISSRQDHMLIIGQNYLTGLHFSECACGWEALPSPQGFETREEAVMAWTDHAR